MARSRYVKPEFYDDTTLAKVSIEARYFYKGLWNWMDRLGVIEDDIRFLKAKIFPYDDISEKKIESIIGALIDLGRLVRFEFEGRKFILCPTFQKHQRFHRDENSKYEAAYKHALSTQQAPPEQPANSVQAMPNATASSPDNGEWITDNGDTHSSVTTNGDLGAIDPFRGDPNLDHLLSNVSHDVQELWLSTYKNEDWIRKELLKAMTWLKTNKRRRKEMGRFLSNWLSNGESAIYSPPSKQTRQLKITREPTC